MNPLNKKSNIFRISNQSNFWTFADIPNLFLRSCQECIVMPKLGFLPGRPAATFFQSPAGRPRLGLEFIFPRPAGLGRKAGRGCGAAAAGFSGRPRPQSRSLFNFEYGQKFVKQFLMKFYFPFDLLPQVIFNIQTNDLILVQSNGFGS